MKKFLLICVFITLYCYDINFLDSETDQTNILVSSLTDLYGKGSTYVKDYTNNLLRNSQPDTLSGCTSNVVSSGKVTTCTGRTCTINYLSEFFLPKIAGQSICVLLQTPGTSSFNDSITVTITADKAYNQIMCDNVYGTGPIDFGFQTRCDCKVFSDSDYCDARPNFGMPPSPNNFNRYLVKKKGTSGQCQSYGPTHCGKVYFDSPVSYSTCRVTGISETIVYKISSSDGSAPFEQTYTSTSELSFTISGLNFRIAKSHISTYNLIGRWLITDGQKVMLSEQPFNTIGEYDNNKFGIVQTYGSKTYFGPLFDNNFKINDQSCEWQQNEFSSTISDLSRPFSLVLNTSRELNSLTARNWEVTTINSKTIDSNMNIRQNLPLYEIIFYTPASLAVNSRVNIYVRWQDGYFMNGLNALPYPLIVIYVDPAVGSQAVGYLNYNFNTTHFEIFQEANMTTLTYETNCIFLALNGASGDAEFKYAIVGKTFCSNTNDTVPYASTLLGKGFNIKSQLIGTDDHRIFLSGTRDRIVNFDTSCPDDLKVTHIKDNQYEIYVKNTCGVKGKVVQMIIGFNNNLFNGFSLPIEFHAKATITNLPTNIPIRTEITVMGMSASGPITKSLTFEVLKWTPPPTIEPRERQTWLEWFNYWICEIRSWINWKCTYSDGWYLFSIAAIITILWFYAGLFIVVAFATLITQFLPGFTSLNLFLMSFLVILAFPVRFSVTFVLAMFNMLWSILFPKYNSVAKNLTFA
jgi:hypothetical protein